MNAMKLTLWTCGAGLSLLASALAAPPGDGAPDVATTLPEPAGKVPDAASAVRSSLWLAVDAQRRGHEAAAPEAQRQLGTEQRLELREQVRRAAAMWSTEAPPIEQRTP